MKFELLVKIKTKFVALLHPKTLIHITTAKKLALTPDPCAEPEAKLGAWDIDMVTKDPIWRKIS